MSSAAAAGIRAFGVDRGLPFPLADLGAADALVLVGANPAETMPPLVRYLTEQREHGGDADRGRPAPHRRPPGGPTCTCSRTPGTDLALANALLHLVIADGPPGRVVRRAPHHRLRRGAPGPSPAYWPERVERLTGVPVADLRAAARLLGGAGRAIILTARGAEQHSKGTDTVLGLDQPGARAGPARPAGLGLRLPHRSGQRPGRARARPEGRPAARLPDDRRPGRPRARGRRCGASTPTTCRGRGCRRTELLDRLGTRGGPRGAAGVRLQPGGLGAAGRRGRAAAGRARPAGRRRLRAVRDRGAGRRRAADRAVGRGGRHDDQPGGPGAAPARAAATAGRGPHRPGDPGRAGRAAGRRRHVRPSPQAVFAELRRASAGGVGRLRRHRPGTASTPSDGVFWPCPSPEHPGTPRLFAERVRHPGRPGPVRRRSSTGEPAEAPGRRPTRSCSPPAGCSRSTSPARRPGGSTPLRRAAPGAFVEVHPDAAERLSIADGDRGAGDDAAAAIVEAPARVVDTIRPDTLFVPFHWAGAARANSLTTDALDPISRMPEFKVCAARLERAAMRIVVVGYGMAGARLVSRAARPGPGRRQSPCSAPSRTRRTTGSCCPTWSPARPREPDVRARRAGRARGRRSGSASPRSTLDPAARTVTGSDGRTLRRTTGWCSPPAPRRCCRRSRGWSATTAACPTGWPSFRTLDDCRRILALAGPAPARRWCSAAGCSGWRRPAGSPPAGWR